MQIRNIGLAGAMIAAVCLCATAAGAGPECGLFQYRARIVAVYDGDSVTADIDLGFNTWRHGEKLRLFGIDAPEMRGANKPAATLSRDRLRRRILGKDVMVCSIKDKTGKYGRYLAVLWDGDDNVNDWLIHEGLAVAYK